MFGQEIIFSLLAYMLTNRTETGLECQSIRFAGYRIIFRYTDIPLRVLESHCT